MAEPNEVESSFAAARGALAEPDFTWIRRSALTERAYWLGLYHGLAARHRGDGLGQEVFRHLRECAAPRAGDDGFGDSPFAEALALMHEAVADPREPELETLDAAVSAVLAHLAEVQAARDEAATAVRAAAEVVLPFTVPEAFRVLSADEHARLQGVVRSLEERLRVLAVVELRWGRRLGASS